MALTYKNLRVCRVLSGTTEYDLIVGVDDLDEIDDILQEWALSELSTTLSLPEALLYCKDITEVITSLDIDNFAYVSSATRRYMDIPRYAGISGTYPTLPTTLDGSNKYVAPDATAYLYAAAGFTGVFGEYDIAEKSFTLSAGVNYLGITYNSGAPMWQTYLDDTSFDYSSIIPVAMIYQVSTTVYVLPFAQTGAGLPENSLHFKVSEKRFSPISTFTLASTSPTVCNLGAIRVNTGVGSVLCAATALGTDLFTGFYKSGGVWTSATITSLNNTQCQGATGFDALGGGKFVINYLYRLVNASNKMMFMVISQEYDTLAQAKEAEPIQDIPGIIEDTSILVGRIIFQQATSTPAAVQKIQTFSWAIPDTYL